MSTPNDRLLRYSLRGNAVFSTVCALIAIAFAAPLASSLGMPDAASLTGLGVQLLVFAALVALLASRPVMRPWLVLGVIAADVLWVVGTVPVVLSGELTFTGNVVAILVADTVGLFALLQYLGYRRTRRAVPPDALGASA